MMYFSRIRIDIAAANGDDLEALLNGNAYGIHQVVWRLFPDDADAARDFLYRIENGTGFPYFYVVSRRPPTSLGNMTRVETKPYEPQLADGQKCSFSLRANPVVTKKDPTSEKRSRHDVIMNAKHQLQRPFSRNAEVSAAEIEYKEGIQWLASRAPKLGFEFDPMSVRVSQYQQHHFKKPNQKHKIRFSSIDYDGELTVTDSNLFLRSLFNGIGPAKAFGCGLMLIKRI